MQAKKRYILVTISCAFLALCYLGGYRLKWRSREQDKRRLLPLKPYLDHSEVLDNHDSIPSPIQRRAELRTSLSRQQCRMESCFDFSKCPLGDLKVYVYPLDETAAPSPAYQKILNVILESRYYTPDPSQACLFVLSLDTLDRDKLSTDYVRNMPARLAQLPHWNDGKNHVIFNLYSGTWPEYEETLGFDIGKAILAKASMSNSVYRSNFDVSIPLFQKEHLEKGGDLVPHYVDNLPGAKNYLLAFKGKRYVYGIGSETRNSLYHLHNGKDIIMVTTCKHGKNWKEKKDERCDEDNLEYDRYDYEVLLQNATFCLVPRGRRLGSFRFVEVLATGCIPVLLSNGWQLPFSEVIHWQEAAIWADERLLLQVPDVVRSIDEPRILAMRQQAQLLWHMYFASVDKIVHTTLEIVLGRVRSHWWRDSRIWNWWPGALQTSIDYADVPSAFPFWLSKMGGGKGAEFSDNYTALVYSRNTYRIWGPTQPLYKLVKNLSRSRYVSKVIVLWSGESPKPSPSRWPSLPVHVVLQIITPPPDPGGVSVRFRPLPQIQTEAILSLDEDAVLTEDEVDFAFHVWTHFPERIVGFPARNHFWDDAKASWGYTSRWTNSYSVVLTGAAIYHRYYAHAYWKLVGPLLHKTVDQAQNCEDLLMNVLVSHVTRLAPLKVSQRKAYRDLDLTDKSPWNDPDHFVQRQSCLNTFAALLGYMPLLRSQVRLDPVLYKDPVSNLRKKYRQMELQRDRQVKTKTFDPAYALRLTVMERESLRVKMRFLRSLAHLARSANEAEFLANQTIPDIMDQGFVVRVIGATQSVLDMEQAVQQIVSNFPPMPQQQDTNGTNGTGTQFRPPSIAYQPHLLIPPANCRQLLLTNNEPKNFLTNVRIDSQPRPPNKKGVVILLSRPLAHLPVPTVHRQLLQENPPTCTFSSNNVCITQPAAITAEPEFVSCDNTVIVEENDPLSVHKSQTSLPSEKADNGEVALGPQESVANTASTDAFHEADVSFDIELGQEEIIKPEPFTAEKGEQQLATPTAEVTPIVSVANSSKNPKKAVKKRTLRRVTKKISDGSVKGRMLKLEALMTTMLKQITKRKKRVLSRKPVKRGEKLTLEKPPTTPSSSDNETDVNTLEPEIEDSNLTPNNEACLRLQFTDDKKESNVSPVSSFPSSNRKVYLAGVAKCMPIFHKGEILKRYGCRPHGIFTRDVHHVLFDSGDFRPNLPSEDIAYCATVSVRKPRLVFLRFYFRCSDDQPAKWTTQSFEYGNAFHALGLPATKYHLRLESNQRIKFLTEKGTLREVKRRYGDVPNFNLKKL